VDPTQYIVRVKRQLKKFQLHENLNLAIDSTQSFYNTIITTINIITTIYD